MDATLSDGEVHVGGDARQRFFDSRGYGRPLTGNEIALAPVEAAHLLYRGDLDAVDGQGFREFLTARGPGFGPRFLVYVDLRDRGFYLSPAREGWVPDADPAVTASDGPDFVVYPRGSGPGDGEVAYRVTVYGERAEIEAGTLEPGVYAIVDEEGDLTYLAVEEFDPGGETTFDAPENAVGTLLDDRVLVWDPPESLYEDGFYGQPLAGRGASHEVLHLSLLEAADLAARGVLSLEGGGGVEALLERGRAVEGERFDRRLRVYRTVRDRGAVPRTGFKFGADFRVYRTVESASELGHSEFLVRARPRDFVFGPRDLALDVRMAHGVRKRMVYGLDGENGDTTRWLAVGRLTP
ncbi:tRNA-intron endonuclease [Halodesulfurarchaeum formicicum]|uniref:tRNA-splicing endonuclease n=1 Tax=Halodesulfurarchaeum formicicum TaxID=1873524 RepID=A0A1D8S1Z8_9EURY|nr:tRNA-intron lyase [Halodesulfurarchaeum formicicum]AOW79392.1 tRNA-intron endonuclease [Halodesulfurarchaeum formicicum]APE94656.1 tRNA-intron endonuclease [Halodesulfurarchaeum formicicum]